MPQIFFVADDVALVSIPLQGIVIFATSLSLLVVVSLLLSRSRSALSFTIDPHIGLFIFFCNLHASASNLFPF